MTVDIARAYDDRPVIVVHDEDQREGIDVMVKRNKWRHMAGTDVSTLTTIRHWSYGILLL